MFIIDVSTISRDHTVKGSCCQRDHCVTWKKSYYKGIMLSRMTLSWYNILQQLHIKRDIVKGPVKRLHCHGMTLKGWLPSATQGTILSGTHTSKRPTTDHCQGITVPRDCIVKGPLMSSHCQVTMCTVKGPHFQELSVSRDHPVKRSVSKDHITKGLKLTDHTVLVS